MRGDAGARSGVEGRDAVRDGVEGAVDRYAEGVVGLSPRSLSLYPDGVLDRPETDPLGVGARAEDVGVGARADDGVVDRTGIGAELEAGDPSTTRFELSSSARKRATSISFSSCRRRLRP